MDFESFYSWMNDVKDFLQGSKEFLDLSSNLKYWSLFGTFGQSKNFVRNAKDVEISSNSTDYGIGLRLYMNHSFHLISLNSVEEWKTHLKSELPHVSDFGKEDFLSFDFDTSEMGVNPKINDFRKKKDFYEFPVKKDPFELDFKDVNDYFTFDSENYFSRFYFSKAHRVFMDENNVRVQFIPRTVLSINLVSDHESYFNKQAVIGGYESIDSDSLFNESNKRLNDILNAKSFHSGKYDIVADGDLTGVFIHEAFGHASEGDHFFSNASCVKNKLNEKIAPDFLEVHDSPIPEEVFPQWGSYFFDDEGTFARDNKIIKNGVFQTFLHNKITSQKFTALKLNRKFFPEKDEDVFSTGNGRVESYSNVPIVRMSNTYIKKGNWKDDELFDMKDGLFLTGSRGGQVNPTSGNFQFNSVIGYVVKNGEIQNAIKGASLIGNTLKTLNDITAVGNKYHNSLAGYCGKDGQNVPVQGYNPYIAIKDAHIGSSKRV